MLGRALYALEMAWHPQFSPASGTARLDFAEPANRLFFDALFRHIQVRPTNLQYTSTWSTCCMLLGPSI